MIVSLSRDVHQTEVGTFEELVFVEDRLRAADGTVLATHQHNRWCPAERAEQTFVRLDVVGPLVVAGDEGERKTLGPYEHFSCVDGVAYVERRVFGFWDLQQRDWYLVDVGRHSKTLRLYRAGV